MTSESYKVSEQELRALEARVEELIRACTHLKEENNSLRRRQEQLNAEKAGLVEKSELAKSRVEAMISRLKSLEPGA